MPLLAVFTLFRVDAPYCPAIRLQPGPVVASLSRCPYGMQFIVVERHFNVPASSSTGRRVSTAVPGAAVLYRRHDACSRVGHMTGRLSRGVGRPLPAWHSGLWSLPPFSFPLSIVLGLFYLHIVRRVPCCVSSWLGSSHVTYSSWLNLVRVLF